MYLAKSESTIERILMVIRLQQFVTWQGITIWQNGSSDQLLLKVSG